MVKALLETDPEVQAAIVRALSASASPIAVELLRQWRESEIYFYAEGENRIPVLLTTEKNEAGSQGIKKIADNQTVLDPEGKPLMVDPTVELESAETDSSLRLAIKSVSDMAALNEPDISKRQAAIQAMGLAQDAEKLPALQTLLGREKNGGVKEALHAAIALIQLKSEDPATQIAACQHLRSIALIASQDALKTVAKEADATKNPAVSKAANGALAKIASHVARVDTYGTMFRGLSLGSVLLVVAIGLAITFGLMGVINMAHGELIAVGAYTTYVVQNIFGVGMALSPFGVSMSLPGMHTTGWLYNSYFIVALPCSFLMAALVGIGLERSIIRFLYKRPLESLLATWGVSLVLQQLFKLVFGSNNVQVSSPTWLSGNWTINDVTLGWNRVFVIAFAVLIILITWLVLNKTSLGLLIRSVMQNRQMAACMGVRTERVNMMTFGFGSGLAGLAGAFLSQIGNVGPNLGQDYIVYSFMTVVVGGVGNILGTVISALGIGITDQTLQQALGNPVLGKILVLLAIILFLQWRPSGLFVTRSRSLES